VVNNQIQAFPWAHWQAEFKTAEQHGFCFMEWTLDHQRLFENPLMTEEGREEIRNLCSRHQVSIKSLTGDCFMQAPFWKAEGEEQITRQQAFKAVVAACHAVGIALIVVPLVDNGRIENVEQEEKLLAFLRLETLFFKAHGVQIIFESDFNPADLKIFIEKLDSTVFGINYDIGNSAALGFDPLDEINAYGIWVKNVHIKDRKFAGTTVPLGTGAAEFNKIFSALFSIGYAGNYVLQTARANDDEHAKALVHYRDMTIKYLNLHEA
jgi:L-ribulose-5-phosphate 3-epimerase